MIPVYEELDVAVFTKDERALVFNTSLLAARPTRSSQGVAVVNVKGKKPVTDAMPLRESMIRDVSRYRARTIPKTGIQLKPEDKGEEQLRLEM